MHCVRKEGAEVKCGKAVALISSGIDSPVASWMMVQKGVEVIGLHCSNSPLSDSKSKDITVRMCGRVGIKKLYIVDYGATVQEEIAKSCFPNLACVLCKRFMFRIAERIAEKEGCCCIITGDNLGQVASQTLENMAVVSKSVSIPVIRPLLCNDKQETIDIARRIGTYEIGLERHPPCRFVPKSPATKASISKVEAEEGKLDVEGMVKNALACAEVIVVR
jgi:tRNA uracil 4-sulfurtransferase